MAEITISNPLAANKIVSDFTTFVTTDGELLLSGQEAYATLRANAAITKGQVLAWVAPTTTVPLSVKPMVSGDLATIFAGIATTAQATAGGPVTMCVFGVCQVAVGAQTAAFGQFIRKPSGTAGECVTDATPLAAADIVGATFGSTLGAKNSANLAPAFVRVV